MAVPVPGHVHDSLICPDGGELPFPSPAPLSSIRWRPRTKSDEYRGQLPSLSARQTGPRPPLRFRRCPVGKQQPITKKPLKTKALPPTGFTHPLEMPNIDCNCDPIPTLETVVGPSISGDGPSDLTYVPLKLPASRPVLPPTIMEDPVLPSIPPFAKSSILCYLVGSSLPIPLFQKRLDDQGGYEQDLIEMNMVLEIFGETRVWSLDVKDTCCHYCVEKMALHDQRHQKMPKIICVKQLFKRANCKHCFVVPLMQDVDSEARISQFVVFGS